MMLVMVFLVKSGLVVDNVSRVGKRWESFMEGRVLKSEGGLGC